MIVFEVRSDGTVISTPSFVAQGISLSDLVVLADADYSLVTMHFTPPSGIYIPDVVFTPTLTQGRNLWQAVMPPEISMISGAVTYQIFLTSADGKTLPTPTGRITVQEGVISNMPETAEELGQYSISALYQLMSNFYASLEGYRQTLDGLTVKTHKWTILASDWTDSTPYQASIVFPHGNYAKPGTLILVAPADNRSREQIEKGGLTVTVHDSGVIGSVPVVDTAVIVRGGKAPTEDINLVLFFIDTQGEDEPLTQWIGIDMGSILPEVTPEDDGKVLGVDGGVWQKVDIPAPLPPILPENESDTLTVEGGAPVWKKNSWNRLTDKPFYEETHTGLIELIWDGDETGKTIVDMGDDVRIAKISDLTPEPSELIGGQIILEENENNPLGIIEESITDARTEGIPAIMVADYAFVFYSPIPAYGITETGVYAATLAQVMKIQYAGTITNIKTLDPKFLSFFKVSDAIADETVSIDGFGLFANLFAFILGQYYLVEFDGVDYHCVANSYAADDQMINYIGNVNLTMDSYENTGEPFIIVATDEACVVYGSTGDHTIKISPINYVKIPQGCLPEINPLPKVTAEDNGKFLMVQDGAWQAVSMQDVSEEGM